MKPSSIPAVFFGLLLASIAVSAQQSNADRICVYGSDTKYANTLAGQVNYSPQARNQRDLVVKYLNEVKAPTSARFRLEAVYEKYRASVDPRVGSETAPLTYVLMYHNSSHLWVSYPYGSYSQYKWFAKEVADVAYATILKNPTP